MERKKLKLLSVITCPFCGFSKKEIMPEDSCVFFYECTNCNKSIRPLKGDCCIFCSYGSERCPSKQVDNHCCAK